MREILLYLSLKNKGDFKNTLNDINNKVSVTKKELDGIERKIKCKYITILDNQYPESLKKIPSPPIVLYYYGNINLLNDTSFDRVAVIGKREASDYGKMSCINIVKDFKKYNAIVVSGLAIGIDCLASQTALDNDIPTIVVLGSGIDNCYPSSNKQLYEKIKEKGLIISEYPNDYVPEPNNFLIRNRIIAGISSKIIVVEANMKSGTMNTVAHGLEQGKDIFAVPYLANTDSGCNYLIKQGAQLIESAKDIFE